MILGLRLLPWVSWARDKARDESDSDEPDPYTEAMYDCTACQKLNDAAQRRLMHCGLLPEMAPGPVNVGSIPLDPPECPGRLVALPEVHEAARALAWRDTGQIRDFYDGEPLTEIAKDAIDLVAAEVKAVERHSMREVARKAKNHGHR